MVEHFEVGEKEASLFLENISANLSKVCRWNPNLFTKDEHVNYASLDMTDKY